MNESPDRAAPDGSSGAPAASALGPKLPGGSRSEGRLGPAAAVGLIAFVALVPSWFGPACAPEAPSERAATGQVASDPPSASRGAGESVVLSVDGETISRRRFDRQLQQMPEYVRARFKSGDKKHHLLGALAQFEVLADVAERRQLGNSPEVVDALESALHHRFLREAVRKRLSIDEISESAIERHYREHPEKYRTPRRRAALVIATESRRRARLIREELAEGSGKPETRIDRFRRTASRRSVDPKSSGRGGSIGWVRPPREEGERPEVARAVFGVEDRGEPSEVFGVGDRWYVATWNRREAERREPLEEVASEIRTELFEQRRRKLRERLTSEWRQEVTVDLSKSLDERLDAPDSPRLGRTSEIPIRTVESDGSVEGPSNQETSK